MNGIIWCPNCSRPFPLGTKVCAGCARSFDRALSRPKRHPLEGTLAGGKWLLKRLIGEGTYAEVFDSEDTLLKRPAAVKVLRISSDEAASSLAHEARIASARHPNICDIYDLGRLPNGRPYLALERLYGETMSTGMRTMHTSLSLTSIGNLFVQILSALHSLHGVKLVHRDLSPKNIFLVDRVGLDPIVKLFDFGLARDTSGATSSIVPPNRHVRVGTLAYMSPEQVEGGRGDLGVDLFAVGTMLYEAVSGKHPFASSSPDLLRERIRAVTPPPLGSLRPDAGPLDGVVLRALEKRREDRWSDALAMQTALQRVLAANR